MPIVQSSYGERDPNERSCRTCMHWEGDRSFPINEEVTGNCSVLSGCPPYFSQVLEVLKVETVTKVTDSCKYHGYHRN